MKEKILTVPDMYSPIYDFLFCKVVEIFRVEKDVNNICKQSWNDEEK